MLTSNDRINRARILLERNGGDAGKFLNADIHESWSRCIDIGLDPLNEPDHIMVSEEALKDLREKNGALLHLAQAEIQNLYSQIAGSNFAIVFASHDGTVLESIFDDSFHSFANTRRIAPGNVWQENTKGTNALGSVMHTGRPSTVHAGEHFFRHYENLTCVAAPIFDPAGKMLGVIDASSDCRSRQHHTHVLVKMSCMTIENCLFRKTFRDKLVIELHNRHEFLGTLQAGLLAFDEEGTLIAANQQACNMLQGVSLQGGVHFNEVFRTPFRDTLDNRNGTLASGLVDLHGSTFAFSTFRSTATSTLFTQSLEKAALAQTGSIHVSDRMPRMVCRDPSVGRIIVQAEKAGQINAPLHIRGETGTGKEMLARFAHTASKRNGKFVAVNCAALPQSLAESELFGYRRGAFTGADRNGAPGLVLQADGGTLFLDEIGDLPLLLQATLLRFLDDWQVRQVGGATERRVDIQLVTATNRDLEQAVQEKAFRADLLYRINAVDVHLPPLRERSDLSEIIPALLETFKQPLYMEPESYEDLQDFPWPGNIRELKNFLIRLGMGADEDGVISRQQVRRALGSKRKNSDVPDYSGESLHKREREIIMEAYKRHKCNVSAVSRELGISRNTVYKKIKEISHPASH